jgi:hypothetical protein
VSSQGTGQREREVLEISLKREQYGWQIGVYEENHLGPEGQTR